MLNARELVWGAVLLTAACGPSTGDSSLADAGLQEGADDPGDPGAPEPEPSCEQVRPIELTEIGPPDLLLVVDKSDSMNWDLGTGQQKWSTMRAALNSLVTQNGDGIRFGLAAYPSDSSCGIGALYTDVGDDTSGAIISALNSLSPSGGTPTDTTLQGALTYFLEQPVNPDGRYVLLATDGEPTCGGLFDTTQTLVNNSIAAIADLKSEGIDTFVLGFGNDINSQPQVLQDMADAGGTNQHYAANSPAQLSAALADIASRLVGPECSFVLDEEPADSDRLQVYFDDVEIGRSSSHIDGFDFDEATQTITFYGEACDSLQEGEVAEVRVDYGCQGAIID